MKTMLLILVLASVGTVIWGLLSRPRSGKGSDPGAITVETKLPAMLSRAKIWGKEMSVACRSPRRMHGSFDEAFQLETGEIVVSETKSRERPVVHKSDVVQLSAYALAVGEGGRHRVMKKGFVRLVTPRKNEYVPVDLVGEHEVARVYDRYLQLSSGKDKGEKCGKAGLCHTCLYKKECDAMG